MTLDLEKMGACAMEAPDLGSGGRHAAGEDPAKREQILAGAKRVFMQKGFDATSMNEVTREAGVSKGTIYVYFTNKEDLFAALISAERDRILKLGRSVLEECRPLDEALCEYGVAMVTGITSEYTIRAMRSVIGVFDRMPKLARTFFEATPDNGLTVLQSYLDAQVKAGRLQIDDTEWAGHEFFALCTAGLFKQRLFGKLDTPPTPDVIRDTVTKAVAAFLCIHPVRVETQSG
ncbi:transcriptional regulator, TetR family [Rhizobium sp. RU20A]|uniref:TetR/AcrR family transcriptional regulator n=1 Tax=Rhizobium sp. RU20A TaxID=1907412 RepID=UPI000956CAE4|nr:TetR/AcrR family transcriptional regulator [Rhizobium sp. RU20A]SIQ99779.1 transcriptional regulator, TetR family [Rhizobium sp. RU20A]